MPRRKKAGKKRLAGENGGPESVEHSNNFENALASPQKSSKNDASNKMDVLPINKRFAEHYEESKRRQLLSNVPASVFEEGDESSSTSEEEDEFGELLTKGIDRKVNDTIEAIRNKDPRIYDKTAKFFEHASGGSEDSNSASDAEDHSEDEPVAGWDTIAKAAQQATPRLTLKDYVRESLLKSGKLSDDEDEATERHGGEKDDIDQESHENLVRVQPGRETQKEEITKKEQGDFIGSDDDARRSDDEESDVGDFFTRKEKTAADLEEEEKEFEVFMKKRNAHASKQAGEDLLLHSYLEKETPDEKERFLRDFVLNNGWLDKNAGEAPGAHEYEIEIDTNDPDGETQGPEDEDEFDEKADNFEAQYNFRFEDPGGAQIVSYARTISDSMRRPDTRRKRMRETRQLRKQQEKAEKVEEIKRLKNMKKKEVKARLLAIQDAAGDGVDLTGIDLEGDFDPNTFNKQMESNFGDEYYSMKDKQMEDVGAEGMSHRSEKPLPAKDRDDVPEDIRGDVNRMMDEYYNLDFEDIVGGVPMRFTYKKVEPESFNMTMEDILNTDDKELNRLVSLKYLAPYRSRRDVQKQAWKVRAALQKRKRAKSVLHEGEDRIKIENTVHDTPVEAENDDGLDSGSRKRKRRRPKSHTENKLSQNEDKTNKQGADVAVQEDNDLRLPTGPSGKAEDMETESKNEESAEGRKKKKTKKKRKSQTRDGQPQMTESRLKAYGITPS